MGENVLWAASASIRCTCGRGAIRLFAHHGTYKCRWCHRAIYTSQRNNSEGRKRLTACKLRLQLGGLPDINEPLPLKPKWTRRRTYQRLRNEIQALEAKAKTKTFPKAVSNTALRLSRLTINN